MRKKQEHKIHLWDLQNGVHPTEGNDEPDCHQDASASEPPEGNRLRDLQNEDPPADDNDEDDCSCDTSESASQREARLGDLWNEAPPTIGNDEPSHSHDALQSEPWEDATSDNEEINCHRNRSDSESEGVAPNIDDEGNSRPDESISDTEGVAGPNQRERDGLKCPCHDVMQVKLKADLESLARPLTELDNIVVNYCGKHLEGEAEGNAAWLSFLELVEPFISKRTSK